MKGESGIQIAAAHFGFEMQAGRAATWPGADPADMPAVAPTPSTMQTPLRLRYVPARERVQGHAKMRSIPGTQEGYLVSSNDGAVMYQGATEEPSTNVVALVFDRPARGGPATAKVFPVTKRLTFEKRTHHQPLDAEAAEERLKEQKRSKIMPGAKWQEKVMKSFRQTDAEPARRFASRGTSGLLQVEGDTDDVTLESYRSHFEVEKMEVAHKTAGAETGQDAVEGMDSGYNGLWSGFGTDATGATEDAPDAVLDRSDDDEPEAHVDTSGLAGDSDFEAGVGSSDDEAQDDNLTSSGRKTKSVVQRTSVTATAAPAEVVGTIVATDSGGAGAAAGASGGAGGASASGERPAKRAKKGISEKDVIKELLRNKGKMTTTAITKFFKKRMKKLGTTADSKVAYPELLEMIYRLCNIVDVKGEQHIELKQQYWPK